MTAWPHNWPVEPLIAPFKARNSFRTHPSLQNSATAVYLNAWLLAQECPHHRRLPCATATKTCNLGRRVSRRAATTGKGAPTHRSRLGAKEIWADIVTDVTCSPEPGSAPAHRRQCDANRLCSSGRTWAGHRAMACAREFGRVSRR